MSLAPQDLAQLRRAKQLLEKPGLVVRASGAIGAPVEKGLRALPGPLARLVGYLARKAIERAFRTALYTLGERPRGKPSNRLHKTAAMLSGAVGGAFGLPALFLELPVATTIMLRSIADIARSEGENLHDPDTRMQCIQVLALGGKGKGDDAAETGYFAARAGLAKAVSDAAKHLAARQVSARGAPVFARLISLVAARFSVVASEKLVAQAVPLLGALGGAGINALFIAHYQRMARGHFTVRRLEREYGTEAVQAAYAQA